MWRIFFGILLIITGLISSIKSEKKIVCYYGTWATYRYGNGKFDVETIDPTICTHLIYSFFGISTDGTVRILDSYLDLEENWGRGNIKKFNALKNKNSNLKTLAAIGGWNEGSARFSAVAQSEEKRKRFAMDTANFCRTHGFDGIDMDWEYPAQRDGQAAIDKNNFVLLLKEMRNVFNTYGLLLTAAVAAGQSSAAISYDIAQISKSLDFINLMAYDFHGPWDDTLAMNAPLYASSADTTVLQRQLNVNSSVNYWLHQGCPREKLILGMPLYGHTYTLRTTSQFSVGSPHSGPGMAGPFTNEHGMIGYNEFCEKQLSGKWLRNWDDTTKVPYSYQDNQWVSYDDVESIKFKSEYVLEMNLGGAMVWSIETDDFLGFCGQNKFPLLNIIKTILKNDGTPSINTSTTTSSPTTVPNATTNPTQSTTRQPGTEIICTEDGIFRHPTDCSSFYICTQLHPHISKCPSGLLFDTNIKSCNWPSSVTC